MIMRMLIIRKNTTLLLISIFVLSSTLLFSAKAQSYHQQSHDKKAHVHAPTPHAHHHHHQSADAIAEQMTTQLAQRLELSEEQTEKVSAIHLKYAKKMHSLHRSAPQQHGKLKGKMRILHEAQEAEMKAILTAEQFIQYSRIKKHMHKRAGHKAHTHQHNKATAPHAHQPAE